jgi:hypothetical protein
VMKRDDNAIHAIHINGSKSKRFAPLAERACGRLLALQK